MEEVEDDGEEQPRRRLFEEGDEDGPPVEGYELEDSDE